MRLESAGLDNFWTKGSCIGPDLFASDLVKAGKVDPRLEPKIGIPRAVFRDHPPGDPGDLIVAQDFRDMQAPELGLKQCGAVQD